MNPFFGMGPSQVQDFAENHRAHLHSFFLRVSLPVSFTNEGSFWIQIPGGKLRSTPGRSGVAGRCFADKGGRCCASVLFFMRCEIDSMETFQEALSA